MNWNTKRFIMTDEEKEQVREALRHGRHGDAELEVLIEDDLVALEPVIDRIISEYHRRLQ